METEYLLIWKDYTEGNPITHNEVFRHWDDLEDFVVLITQNDLVGCLQIMKWNGVKLVSMGTAVVKEVEKCW